ncbi:hypothetical protein ACOMICROBIO_GDFFDHBD_00371 [Vibrio sp. B1REV9]|nr:hypothetical protein ACOMICROBIO_GDFFDHBD_00371 [Vibrio sp. B1REV9]
MHILALYTAILPTNIEQEKRLNSKHRILLKNKNRD